KVSVVPLENPCTSTVPAFNSPACHTTWPCTYTFSVAPNSFTKTACARQQPTVKVAAELTEKVPGLSVTSVWKRPLYVLSMRRFPPAQLELEVLDSCT